MNSSHDQFRMALIGCGAIAQAHAQAIARVSNASCTVVYDIDHERAEKFRQSFCPEAQVARVLGAVGDHADAAIVAVPNAHHASISISLLRAGLHVLCEKPLALSSADAREMVSVAEEHGAVLTCGFLRRFYNSTALVLETLNGNLLGRPIHFEVRESVWNWPMNRSTFDRRIAGGGVLMDMGPHVFDLLNLWFGPLQITEYVDDNEGGVEASCIARLQNDKVSGVVYLTRAYRTINRTRIICENGFIDLDPHNQDNITITFNKGTSDFPTTAHRSPQDPFVNQLENFLGVINGKVAAIAPGRAAIPTVNAIETCYNHREPLIGRWEVGPAPPVVAENAYRKILITGASGSVGSRLVELWAAEGKLGELRCMVRSYRTAARIMRYPVEIVEADLLDTRSVMRAAEGCDAIIHLGVGEKAGRETQPLLDAAVSLGIRRFVHMSSAAVYGMRLPAHIEELQDKTSVTKTGEPYADEKAKAEWAVRRACERGLEAIILRPHMVYGPGLRWSAELMELLAEDKIAILDDGGWCNLIYVDDLVRAVSRALVTKEGFGEPLFVTDNAPIKWSEYIEAHAGLIGVEVRRISSRDVLKNKLGVRGWITESAKPLVGVVRSQEFRRFVFESPAVQSTIFRLYLRLRESPRLQPLIGNLRGSGRVQASPDRSSINPLWAMLQTSEARLSADRADTLIGFRAEVTFSEGLRRSTSWFEQFGMMPTRNGMEKRGLASQVSFDAS